MHAAGLKVRKVTYVDVVKGRSEMSRFKEAAANDVGDVWTLPDKKEQDAVDRVVLLSVAARGD
jgi:hypothetical protein